MVLLVFMFWLGGLEGGVSKVLGSGMRFLVLLVARLISLVVSVKVISKLRTCSSLAMV